MTNWVANNIRKHARNGTLTEDTLMTIPSFNLKNLDNWDKYEIYIGSNRVEVERLMRKRHLEDDSRRKSKYARYNKSKNGKGRNKKVDQVRDPIRNKTEKRKLEWQKSKRKSRARKVDERKSFLQDWNKDPIKCRAENQTFTWEESEKHEKYLENLTMLRCTECGRIQIRDCVLKNGFCEKCKKHKVKKSVNPFSSKILHMTRPPDDLPELNEIEIQFISRACLIVNVHRLSGGQKGRLLYQNENCKN